MALKLKEMAKLSLSDPNYDPWSKHEMHKITAERVRRHLFNPLTHTWETDETIVKVEKSAFDAGAMRQCFRLKKLSHCPYASHHYHSVDWTHAQNYVAKSFKTPGGEPDERQEARAACFDDVKLQYEAAHWAEEFNAADPPKKIKVIRAYAIEFIDRENHPVMGLERFIPGKDENGVGYVKHNTNAGFVDRSLHRITPQTFSAHSFYKSGGTRMVVDIQGVGDLYTDPQVHSLDGRFGNADLGVRGFALFFANYQHTSLASALGVPIFPLSRPELQRLNKEEEEAKAAADKPLPPVAPPAQRRASMLARKDAVLMKRLEIKKTFETLKKIIDEGDEDEGDDEGEKDEDEVEQSERERAQVGVRPRGKSRSDSMVDHLRHALKVAATGASFEYMNDPSLTKILDERQHAHVAIIPDDNLKAILGKVHVDISVLYGMRRFADSNNGEICIESAFFHICHAASLGNATAMLALGRLLLGLGSSLCEGLLGHVDVDDASALEHLRKAAATHEGAEATAAACLIAKYGKGGAEERSTNAERVLRDVAAAKEAAAKANRIVFKVDETVEAAFEMGADYYRAQVREILDGGNRYRVFYIEDEVEEELSGDFIRRIEGGGGCGGGGDDDDAPPTPASVPEKECLSGDVALALQEYDILALLGSLSKARGDMEQASAYYSRAATSAMAAGKMALANNFVALSEEE